MSGSKDNLILPVSRSQARRLKAQGLAETTTIEGERAFIRKAVRDPAGPFTKKVERDRTKDLPRHRKHRKQED